MSKEGRYNPSDPNNKLVEINGSSLPVVVDGYINDFDERFFNDPVLITNWTTGPFSDILIKFDMADLPAYVSEARLELWATPASFPDFADVLLIGQSWNPSTVTWAQMQSAEFIDWSLPIIPNLDANLPGDYASCDVTDYVLHMQNTGNNFGFLIVSWMEFIEFESSRGANPPRLRIWGWDIPD
jgi:hypothetical protein